MSYVKITGEKLDKLRTSLNTILSDVANIHSIHFGMNWYKKASQEAMNRKDADFMNIMQYAIQILPMLHHQALILKPLKLLAKESVIEAPYKLLKSVTSLVINNNVPDDIHSSYFRIDHHFGASDNHRFLYGLARNGSTCAEDILSSFESNADRRVITDGYSVVPSNITTWTSEGILPKDIVYHNKVVMDTESIIFLESELESLNIPPEFEAVDVLLQQMIDCLSAGSESVHIDTIINQLTDVCRAMRTEKVILHEGCESTIITLACMDFSKLIELHNVLQQNDIDEIYVECGTIVAITEVDRLFARLKPLLPDLKVAAESINSAIAAIPIEKSDTKELFTRILKWLSALLKWLVDNVRYELMSRYVNGEIGHPYVSNLELVRAPGIMGYLGRRTLHHTNTRNLHIPPIKPIQDYFK